MIERTNECQDTLVTRLRRAVAAISPWQAEAPHWLAGATGAAQDKLAASVNVPNSFAYSSFPEAPSVTRSPHTWQVTTSSALAPASLPSTLTGLAAWPTHRAACERS